MSARPDTPRPWGEADLEKLRELWLIDGLSGTQIANHFGRSRSAICGKVRRMGWSKMGTSTQSVQSKLSGHCAPKTKTQEIEHPTLKKKPGAFVGNLGLWFAADSRPGKPLRVHDVPAGALPIMALRFSSCRWPVGEAAGEDQLFCGAEQAHEHTSYCAGHHKIATGRSQPEKGQ